MAHIAKPIAIDIKYSQLTRYIPDIHSYMHADMHKFTTIIAIDIYTHPEIANYNCLNIYSHACMVSYITLQYLINSDIGMHVYTRIRAAIK